MTTRRNVCTAGLDHTQVEPHDALVPERQDLGKHPRARSSGLTPADAMAVQLPLGVVKH